jgi:hypothetical protein
MPNHCSAPQASNRPASVNPSFAARRIERALAVWVKSTTGSPGNSPASQPSAAAHASAAYPLANWNGSSWTTSPSPLPSDTEASIGSAASSPSHVWLFGYDANTGEPLILSNNS